MYYLFLVLDFHTKSSNYEQFFIKRKRKGSILTEVIQCRQSGIRYFVMKFQDVPAGLLFRSNNHV